MHEHREVFTQYFHPDYAHETASICFESWGVRCADPEHNSLFKDRFSASEHARIYMKILRRLDHARTN